MKRSLRFQLRCLCSIACAALLFSAVSSVKAQTLLLGGTGSAEPLLRILLTEFAKQQPSLQANVINPALGSSGGIAALIQGKIDIAVVSRELKSTEKDKVGRQFKWCTTPFVLVSQGGQWRKGFTLDELARIYHGNLRNWENGTPIRLVLRNIDDSETLLLKAMSPSLEKATNAANARPGMVFGQDDLETLAILTRTQGSLGPSTLGLLQTSGSNLTVFSINGIEPSAINLKNGSYPWQKSLLVMLPLKPKPEAEKFAAFLQSEKAHAILTRYNYLASN